MRLACVYVPSFPLAAWLRVDPELRGGAVAVVEGQGPRARVVASSSAAAARGVRVGLTAAQSKALYADLIVRPVSPDAERAAQAALGDVADTFSPRVEDAGAGVIYLEVDGTETLHGGERDVAHALVRRAWQLGLEAHVGIASTKIGAALAARHSEGITVIPAAEEWQFLSPLPLHLLSPSPGLHETFSRWGLRCLGDLAALPASAVATRLGPEAALLARRARGEDDPLVPRPAPICFEETAELEYGIETLEPFLFALRALLDRLTARLVVRGFVCGDLRLSLGLVSRGRDERTVIVAAPSNDTKALLTLIRLQLEAHAPPAAVERICIAAVPEQLRPAQFDLFRPQGPAPEQLAITLARLTALCGADRLGQPVVADSHRPDAYEVRRVSGVGSRVSGRLLPDTRHPVPDTREEVGRGGVRVALRAIRPPRAVEVFCNRGQLDFVRLVRESAPPDTHPPIPGIAGRVVTAAGPWRVQGEWWSPHRFCRDYYDVQLSDGGVYRLYHDQLQQAWFVDGAYD